MMPCEYLLIINILLWFYSYGFKSQDGPLTLPRPILLDMLQAKLSNLCTIHTSKQMVNYATLSSGAILLHFIDGSEATTDVLIGSDGVHSATRSALFKSISSQFVSADSYIAPKWSGTLCYRCTVPLDRFKEAYPEHQALTQPKIVRRLLRCTCFGLLYSRWAAVVRKEQGHLIHLIHLA